MIFEKYQEQIILLICDIGTTMKIYGHMPKIQVYALSLWGAIFIAVFVFKWSQGEGREKYDFFVCGFCCCLLFL